MNSERVSDNQIDVEICESVQLAVVLVLLGAGLGVVVGGFINNNLIKWLKHLASNNSEKDELRGEMHRKSLKNCFHANCGSEWAKGRAKEREVEG